MTYGEYEQEVKRHLTEKRFYHSQCVAACAAQLAERYGAGVEKARLAGLLHDIMKDTEEEEQLKIMERFGIMLSQAQLRGPKLWHALSGAAYIEYILGVGDREIVDAVACHTGGKAGMGLLDKVLFVADYISSDRDYPGVERMRELAKSSLEAAMVEGIAFTVSEKTRAGQTLDPQCICAYNEALWALEDKKKGKG